MSNDRDIPYAIVGFCFGIWAFFHGFNRLRRMRLIQNTPTSTVRGLAMGLVELEGVVRPTNILRSPLTGTECAVYKYQVEEYRSSGKSGRWVTVAKGDSFYCPFYLEDATGKIKVYASGAEIFWGYEYQFETGIGKTIPEKLVTFLDQNGIKYRGWLGTKKMRFSEWYIQDGRPLYVLGTAQADDELAMRDNNNRLLTRLEKLKEDRQWLKEVDTDKSGNISQEEWEAAVARIESELISETMNTNFVDNAQGVMISGVKGGDPFMISCDEEWKLIGNLYSRCMWCIWGGPALSLVTLAYLIWRVPMVWHF